MPPDAEQRLESERLILRPIAKEVAASILAGDMPDGMKFAEGYPDEFSVEVMDLLAGKRQDEDPGFAPLFIILKEEDAVIGEISASWKAGETAAAVGYHIVQPRQRQGFATEALRIFVAYLLAQPGLEVVIADTFPEHIASRRVMEKAGMTLARTIRRVEDGDERDLVVYELRGS
jgi:ribosomal-protein-alanine N-acetyltransferase